MRIRALIPLALAVAGSAGVARAQTYQKPALGAEGAKRVADAVLAEAKRLATTGVVAVVDDGGNLVYLARIDNTFAAGALISYGKARTAALFKRPTSAFEIIIREGRTPMIALPDFTPLKGGVPLEVGGQIVGAVGVSGAASADQDEALAQAGARALDAGAARTGSAPVSYFDRGTVEQSFAQGGVLLDGHGRRYQVHTSRRDRPGQAELHQDDTDLFYVLTGSATLVTGGSMVGAQQVAAGEFRGTGIEGGEVRKIAAGDVVVIPAGTPHWFKTVQGPVTYYTVKAR